MLTAPYADVRPAWAHSYGCKSRRKLITTSEAKRNCMRATECGEEAWSINCEPINKNRIPKLQRVEFIRCGVAYPG